MIGNDAASLQLESIGHGDRRGALAVCLDGSGRHLGRSRAGIRGPMLPLLIHHYLIDCDAVKVLDILSALKLLQEEHGAMQLLPFSNM